MLILMLLWDPVLQVLVLGPLILFMLGYGVPEWLAVADVLGVVFVLALGVRRQLRRDAAANPGPSTTDYIWTRGWTAAAYVQRLSLFLRLAGWRVGDSVVRADDRATLIAEKFTYRLALLLVRPDREATPADIVALRALGAETRATHAALVSFRQVRADPGGLLAQKPLLFMRYKDLPVLDDVLGLGL
jgi:hypothetical protein